MEESKNWMGLPVTEKENYLLFHKTAYADDISTAEDNAIRHPRWAIIAGYYAMHDITKLFLAKEFSIKITSPNIHEKAIKVLEEFVHDKKLKEKLIELLKEAKEAYFNAERLKENTLSAMLKYGKAERGKTQYYSEDYSGKAGPDSQKASYFLDTIAIPYVKIIERMVK